MVGLMVVYAQELFTLKHNQMFCKEVLWKYSIKRFYKSSVKMLESKISSPCVLIVMIVT